MIFFMLATNSRIIGPLNPPKGDFDYVLLRVSTNARFFLVKKSVCSPLYWRGVGGEAFHERMTISFPKYNFYIYYFTFIILHFLSLTSNHLRHSKRRTCCHCSNQHHSYSAFPWVNASNFAFEESKNE